MWLRMLALSVSLFGCTTGSKPAADAGSDNHRRTVPDASCEVTLEDPPQLPGVHVPVGSTITSWNSNPPSSGEHYPLWAAFREHTSPVPRGYYVHDEEHGAVVFLYNCGLVSGDCSAVIQGLRDAVAALSDDPLCAGTPVRVRAVISPDPLIESPVAAVAWGHVYHAQCLDAPSLRDFARAHYAQAPENECAEGVTAF